MKENKIITYLLYAAGEIILVVVGILIAVSIDDWNQNRKEEQRELKALIDLQAEFNSNDQKLLLDKQIKTAGMNHTNTRLQAIYDRNALPLISIKPLGWHGAYTYNGSNAVLNSLLMSGDINLIQNDSLKYLLTAWSEIVTDFKEDEELHLNFIVNDFTSYQRKFLTIGHYPPDESEYMEWYNDRPVLKQRYELAMDDPLLENLLQNNLIFIEIILEEMESVEQALTDIQRILAKEIQSKS
jgi:hypothetical protein